MFLLQMVAEEVGAVVAALVAVVALEPHPAMVVVVEDTQLLQLALVAQAVTAMDVSP